MRTTVGAALLVVCVAGCTPSAPAPEGLTTEQSRFAADVGALDTHLSDAEVAVRLGETVCADLGEGVPVEEVAVRSQRFTGGEVALDRAEALGVVEAAREHLC